MPIDGGDTKKAPPSVAAAAAGGPTAAGQPMPPALAAAHAVLAALESPDGTGPAAAAASRARLAERIVALHPRPSPVPAAAGRPAASSETRTPPLAVLQRTRPMPLDLLARELALAEQRMSEQSAAAAAPPPRQSIASVIASMPALPAPAAGAYGVPVQRPAEALLMSVTPPRLHPIEHAPGFLFGLLLAAMIGITLYVLLVS